MPLPGRRSPSPSLGWRISWGGTFHTGPNANTVCLLKTCGTRLVWLRLSDGYRAKCFAERYSEEEMEDLLKRAPHISFAHVIQLLSVPKKGARVKFELGLKKHHWTVKQLNRAIQSKCEPSKKSGGPRIKLPGRLKDRLQDMRDVVKSLNKRWSKWREELGKFNRATSSRGVAVVLKGLRDEAKVLSDSVAARLLEVGEV